MKNKFTLSLSLAILIAAFLLAGINQAQAVGDAYFPQDTTVALDVGNMTIEGGSDADSVVATNNNITLTISADQTFVLLSSGKKRLSNNGGYSFECSSTQSRIQITSSTTKTVVISPTSETCESAGTVSGSSSSSGGGGSTITVSTPTPTPMSTPASTVATPTPTPSSIMISTSKPIPASLGFISLAAVSLKDGDVISASGSSDPDIYIPNVHGYKRLFLNPAIFNFYGHLGGFGKVKKTTSTVRDTLVTSGLFRNCETNDPKVYGVEVTGEDTGKLHWVNTTGAQAVADDPNFFKKVFCINTKEFSWYPQGAAYTSVNQIPDYTRKNMPSTVVSTAKQYKVYGASELNVRATASTAAALLGKIPEGQVIESLGTSGLWHKIKYQNKDAWVHGSYLKAL